MALMPESWQNMPTVMARMTGLRYWREKSLSAEPDSLQMHRGDDFIELLFGLGNAGEAQDFEGFVEIGLRDQPARAAGNDEQHDQEKQRRYAGDAEHPAPVGRAEVHAADHGVRYVGEQNADDDVDLEGSHQAAAPLRAARSPRCTWGRGRRSRRCRGRR